MAVSSIFNKNLKTISRDWSYFFVLIVCPTVLILVAGGMLNSFDTKNIYIGAYDEAGFACDSKGKYVPPFDLYVGFGRTICYVSLESCLNDVSSSAIGACLHVKDSENFYVVDVYLDTSRRLVEYYAKQLVLEQVLGSQTSFIEQTSDELSAKVILYSMALADARRELVNTEVDLQEQETLLTQKREELRRVKQDFDTVYVPLKAMEPDFYIMRQDLIRNKQNLDNNISYFNNRRQQIENDISALKSFLSLNLDAAGYSYSASVLDSILTDLNQINEALDDIQSFQNTDDLITAIDLLGSIIPKLDSINTALINTDNDLGLAIDKTRESKQKVSSYIVKLDEVTQEIEGFNDVLDTKTLSLEFKENEAISRDPVLFAFPLLVAIIMTFTSIILSNLFVLRKTNKASYFRELISPAKDVSFLTADYLVNLFFIFIQAIVLFMVGFLWIGVPLSTLSSFAAVILVTCSLFIFMGMGIGYLIRSQSLSMLLSIFLVMLFFVVSELLIPIPLIAPGIRFFIELNPFVLLAAVLKNIFVLNKPILDSFFRMFALSFFLACSVIFAYISKKINKKRIKD
ncbi:MAG: ABC transporter permease [Nanoarchaeota archaeon]|nr:ABC transporter permease [Nanoarchaeota archaeon]